MTERRAPTASGPVASPPLAPVAAGRFETDAGGIITTVSPELLAILGRRPGQLVGRDRAVLLHPDDPGDQNCPEPPTAAVGPRPRRGVYAHADGSPVPVLVIGDEARDVTGRLTGLTGLVIALTAGERAHEELVAAHRELVARQLFCDALLDALPLAVVGCDARGQVTHLNATGREWHGRPLDGKLAPGPLSPRFGADGRTPLPAERTPLARTLLDGDLQDAEIVIAPTEKRAVRALASGRRFYSSGGELLGAVVAMRDITAERSYAGGLRARALYDDLTGLANRALLADRIDTALAQRVTGSGRGVALLVLDLDDFKIVNDVHGHEFGDLLLMEVAASLRLLCRDGDTVARLGGDEFALVLPDADAPEALRVADRILEVCRQPAPVEPLLLNRRCSIGVTVASGQDRSSLLREADVAMYAAKRQGGGSAVLFDAEMHARVLARESLTAELHGAAARGELCLEYQPVIRLSRTEMVGVEALVRWEHPVHGRIAPLEFIGLAEQTGSIRQIGEWVLREACEQLMRWDVEHRGSRPLSMAVNLAPSQLLDPGLVARVAVVLRDTGVVPGRITLEVTESAFAGETPALIGQLERLKVIGVRLAIDDFGTGYSSLSFLRRLPVDTLKIDKSFVDGLAREPEEWAVTSAIVRLAASLGKETLAEGIELGAQLAHLRALNCDLGQGYLFDRPLPAAAIGERIHAAGARP